MKFLKFYKFRFWLIAFLLLMLTAPSSSFALKNVRNDFYAREDDKRREYINTFPPVDSAPIRTLNLKETLEKIDYDAAQALAKIDKQLLEVEAALNNPKARNELEKQKSQVRVQLREIVNDEQKYKQALENPNIPQYVKNLLMRAKKNPEEIEKIIEEQSNPKILAEKQKQEIRRRRDLAKKQARERALRIKLPFIKK